MEVSGMSIIGIKKSKPLIVMLRFGYQKLNVTCNVINQTKKIEEVGYTIMRFWDHDVTKNIAKCINQIFLYIELINRLSKWPIYPLTLTIR